MPVSLQVMYPVSEDSTFDHAYYADTHMKLVGEHMGPHLKETLVTKGLAGGGPDAPAPMHAVASMIFESQEDLQAALAVAGPVLADLPNFTNVQPHMMVGEVIG